METFDEDVGNEQKEEEPEYTPPYNPWQPIYFTGENGEKLCILPEATGTLAIRLKNLFMEEWRAKRKAEADELYEKLQQK